MTDKKKIFQIFFLHFCHFYTVKPDFWPFLALYSHIQSAITPKWLALAKKNFVGIFTISICINVPSFIDLRQTMW